MRLKYFQICTLIFFTACSIGKQTTVLTRSNDYIDFEINGDVELCSQASKCEVSWNRQDKKLRIDGFIPCEDYSDEVIRIEVEGIDLEHMEYPHIVDCDIDENAQISWYSEKDIVRESYLCSGSESNCAYLADVKSNRVKLVLLGFDNQVLQGRFEGRIFLQGIGKLKFTKTSEFKDIRQGFFNVKMESDSHQLQDLVMNQQ